MGRQIAILVFLSVAVGSGCTLGQTQSTVAKLPPVGLAATETAQVNLTNIGVFTCTGSVAFYDDAGVAIGEPANFTVAHGQIFSAALPYPGMIWGSAGSRIVLRPEMTYSTELGFVYVPADAQLPSPCTPLYSLETYDTTSGVTHSFTASPGVALPGFPVLAGAPPGAMVVTSAIGLPPVGLAATETGEVNVTNNSAQTCTGYIEFDQTSGADIPEPLALGRLPPSRQRFCSPGNFRWGQRYRMSRLHMPRTIGPEYDARYVLTVQQAERRAKVGKGYARRCASAVRGSSRR